MTDYTELVKALRYCTNEDNVCTQEKNCGYYGKGFFCQDSLMNDAAAAIEALPKRGEWLTYSAKNCIYKCSLCSHVSIVGKTKYCPNCGAKMEVQA